MTVSSIELYQILEKKIGFQEARTLVEYVKEEVHEQLENSKSVLATKVDLSILSEKMNVLDVRMAQFETRMAQFETRITRWMFIFWAGQIGVLITILEIFFKK